MKETIKITFFENQGQIMKKIINVQSNVRKNHSGKTITGYLIDDKWGDKIRNNRLRNIPLPDCKNIPLSVLGQCDTDCHDKIKPYRRYTRAKNIETLAVRKFRQNGRGITFNDLLSGGLAEHKPQAQATLKYCHRAGILFTPYSRKPQIYYPTSLKSEILNKIIPVRPIGVGLRRPSHLQGSHTSNRSINHDQGLDAQFIQTLEGYILPVLPKTPLHIHKMHFKIRISPECYQEIMLPAGPWNKGKEHEEIIGCTRAKYLFYANGTVIVSTESSNNPFRLVTESDCSTLMAFLGQLRDRLVLFLADKHERIVPDIMSWELTQCDINKDVHIEKWSQPTGLSIQVRHLSHLIRFYIKFKDKDPVCRVEESIASKGRSVVEAITEIFNPTERLEKQIGELSRKIDQLFDRACLLGSKNVTNGTYEEFDKHQQHRQHRQEVEVI